MASPSEAGGVQKCSLGVRIREDTLVLPGACVSPASFLRESGFLAALPEEGLGVTGKGKDVYLSPCTVAGLRVLGIGHS